MEISATLLTSGSSPTNATSYASDSITPSAGRLVIAAISTTLTGADPNTPTCSGCGMTWTQIGTAVQTQNNRQRTTLFRSVGSSPSAGALTFDLGGQTQLQANWAVIQFLGADVSGTNASNAIVQSATDEIADTATSKSVSLSALAKPNNAVLGVVQTYGYGAIVSPGSGYTELTETNGGDGMNQEVQFKARGSTTVDWSFSGATERGTVVAVEIKSAQRGGAALLAAIL